MIDPFTERTVHSRTGTSYGLGPCSYDIRIAQDLWLPAMSHMILASTVEYFRVPHDLRMSIKDKSSLVRQGITVQNTHADPGWCGFLTLEILNNSLDPFCFRKGDPVAQVLFDRLDEPTDKLYQGKYQDQEAGPQPWRKEI